MRTVHVPDSTTRTLHPIIRLDRLVKYAVDYRPASSIPLTKMYVKHETIDHETEYVRGDVHTQNIDNY